MRKTSQSGWSIIDLFWLCAAATIGAFVGMWARSKFGRFGFIGGFAIGYAILPVLFWFLRRKDSTVHKYQTPMLRGKDDETDSKPDA